MRVNVIQLRTLGASSGMTLTNGYCASRFVFAEIALMHVNVFVGMLVDPAGVLAEQYTATLACPPIMKV